MLFVHFRKVICLFFVFIVLGLPLSARDVRSFYLSRAAYFMYVQPDSTAKYLYYADRYFSSAQNDSLMGEFLLLGGLHLSILGDNKAAIEKFKKAQIIFKNLQIESKEAEVLINIGEVVYNWGKYDESLSYFKEVLHKAQSLHLPQLESRALNYIGKYYHSLGDFGRSLDYYHQSLQKAQESMDTVSIVSIQNKIGKHYETLGNYPKALEYYLFSEEMLQMTNNMIETASTYNSLGNIYHLIKEYPKALFFHNKALAVRQTMNYQEGVAKSLNNVGEVLIDTEQLDSALHCFSLSLRQCLHISYSKGAIKSMHNQGLVYQLKNKYDVAVRKFKQALDLSNQIGYDKGTLAAYLALAKIYKEGGKLVEAERLSKEGLEIAIKENVRTSIRDFYLNLSQIKVRKGEYEAALFYYKKHSQVNSEIVNLDSNKRIAELQSQYEVSLKIRENEVLKKENQIKALMIKRKNQLMLFAVITFFLLLALLLIIYGMFLHKKKANDKLTVLNANVTAQNAELDRLIKKLQHSKDQQVKLFSIISHELRNPLYWFRKLIQMLTSQMLVLDKEMIAKSLHSLSESANNTFHLMDNLLHWSRSQLGNINYVPEPVDFHKLIGENIKLVSQYASYKELRIIYKHKSECRVLVDKAMVQTVLRNLLSNAIKFTPSKGKIEISCESTHDQLIVHVADDGVGMNQDAIDRILHSNGTSYIPTSDQETGSGIGLALTKEFVERNGGKLQVKSKEGKGSVFTFDLPLYQH